MNIVHIFCDELRQDALGCYGNAAGTMRTPNMDSVARCGTLFENLFLQFSCVRPLKSQYADRAVSGGVGVFHNEAAWKDFTMPCKPLTYPEVLQAAGYHTANFGKTHLPLEMHPFELDDTRGGRCLWG